MSGESGGDGDRVRVLRAGESGGRRPCAGGRAASEFGGFGTGLDWIAAPLHLRVGCVCEQWRAGVVGGKKSRDWRRKQSEAGCGSLG